MIGRSVELTEATQVVLQALVTEPARPQHGADLLAQTGLSGGKLWPVLARLESVRWLDSGWEAPAEHIQGWPRRRYYRLSSDGLALARGALASAQSSTAATGRLRTAEGT
jgi:PadR family transcriptional regulator, regulatory protein PadR